MPHRCLWSAFAAVGLVALASQPANAYTILAPDSSVAGTSIANWTAAWWTWALQAPAAASPLTDTTGAFANVNNNGPVFFVADTNGSSGPVSRSFQVPGDRPILVPLINLVDLEPAETDPPTATLADRQNAANAVVAAWLGAVNTASLFASIDGTPVPNLPQFLEVTGPFSAGPVQANSYAESQGLPTGAELVPAQSAGYWLMIDGLEPGSHTLRFGGSSGPFTPAENCCTNFEFSAFSVDVTDNIAVPEPASAILLSAGLLGLGAAYVVGRPMRRSQQR